MIPKDYSNPNEEIPQILQEYDIDELLSDFKQWCRNKYGMLSVEEIGFFNIDLYDALVTYVETKYGLGPPLTLSTIEEDELIGQSLIESAADATYLLIRIWEDAGLVTLANPVGPKWYKFTEL